MCHSLSTFYFLPLDIAKSLTKRLLHFNTFGGNPMACAIGSAVLEVRSSSCGNITRFTKQLLQNSTHIIRTLPQDIIQVESYFLVPESKFRFPGIILLPLPFFEIYYQCFMYWI